MSGTQTVVDYLVLAPEPHLVACECQDCKARFIAPRAACAKCGGRSFANVRLPDTGTVRTYSVVRRPPPDAVVPVPYVPAVITLTDGTSISATLVDVDPADVHYDMEVTLTTFPIEDTVAFGFRPVA